MSLAKLSVAIKAAITANDRHENTKCLTILFEADSTRAKDDAADFRRAMSRHFGAVSSECLLGTRPIVDFNTCMAQEFEDSYTTLGRGPHQDLLILHFSGHGRLLPGTKLTLSSGVQGSRSLHFAVIDGWIQDFQLSNEYVDVLVVLDACYSGAGQYRGAQDSSYEMIWVASKSQTTSARGPGLSFTQKVLGAINTIKDKSQLPAIDPVEIVTYIKKTSKSRALPGHSLMSGEKRLCLFFKEQSEQLSQMPSKVGAAAVKEPMAKAVLSIELPEDPESESTKSFLAELRKLSINQKKIEIISIEKVQSSLILLRAPITWALQIVQIAQLGLVQILGIIDNTPDPRSKIGINPTSIEACSKQSLPAKIFTKPWSMSMYEASSDIDPDESSPVARNSDHSEDDS